MSRVLPLLLLLAAPLAAQTGRVTTATPPTVVVPDIATVVNLPSMLDEMRLRNDLNRDLSRNLLRDIDLSVNLNLDQLQRRSQDLALQADEIAMRNYSLASLYSYDNGPRAGWAKDDPADSLYRSAREALNTGDYRRAATLFEDIPKKFPKSVYVKDAPYWQAFALYRIGGTTELTQALGVLEKWKTDNPAPAKSTGTNSSSSSSNSFTLSGSRVWTSSNTGRLDVDGLAAQIAGVLLTRGMGENAAVKRALAARGDACDSDDQSVRAEALSAIMHSNAVQGRDLAAKILARKDECSVPLRRNALMMMATSNDAAALPLVINAARSDASMSIRTDAISTLSRLKSDEALGALDELSRNTDPKIQRAAIDALGSSSNPGAKAKLRAMVTRTDLSESLKLTVIDNFGSRDATAADAAMIQSMYARETSLRVKERLVSAVIRMGGDANEKWLISIAQKEDEPASVRSLILTRLGKTMEIPALTKFYDTANSRDMRESIISLLGSRTEPAAVDKLIEIVKNGTDPSIRRAAIGVLARSKDPRAVKLLLDLVDK